MVGLILHGGIVGQLNAGLTDIVHDLLGAEHVQLLHPVDIVRADAVKLKVAVAGVVMISMSLPAFSFRMFSRSSRVAVGPKKPATYW